MKEEEEESPRKDTEILSVPFPSRLTDLYLKPSGLTHLGFKPSRLTDLYKPSRLTDLYFKPCRQTLQTDGLVPQTQDATLMIVSQPQSERARTQRRRRGLAVASSPRVERYTRLGASSTSPPRVDCLPMPSRAVALVTAQRSLHFAKIMMQIRYFEPVNLCGAQKWFQVPHKSETKKIYWGPRITLVVV